MRQFTSRSQPNEGLVASKVTVSRKAVGSKKSASGSSIAAAMGAMCESSAKLLIFSLSVSRTSCRQLEASKYLDSKTVKVCRGWVLDGLAIW